MCMPVSLLDKTLASLLQDNEELLISVWVSVLF